MYSVEETVGLAFEAFDAESKRGITVEEMSKILKGCFKQISETEIKNIFLKIDVDKDGIISKSLIIAFDLTFLQRNS